MNPPSNQLRAIVTGASSGIGKATALAFAKSGIEVALVSRSMVKLKTVADEIEALGTSGKVKIYSLDLEILDRVRQQISDICLDFGSIDILVNNAGMGYTNSLHQTSLEDWQRVLNLNLTSAFQCIQGVLPQMRDRKSGTIVNVASIAAFNAFPNWGIYGVSKAALVALSKALSVEEREHGIRTVTISPGSVNTPIWDTDTVQADFNRSAMLTPEIVAQSILHAALLPQEAVVEEMIVMPNGGAL
ncbi:SDR family oxidoreductase [Waterburya agarophytonicola K14]|uniref:SDR family oxidoreductase n=1 Tax=Waterburya agarophytonicola KI4 TaxID=2874699 RepID=A0A964BQZ6_9CYAN|nr:SDR family oxidoreductase [Waterburya agarophytonicola]MCC0177609.1 SDR family oxidoreductase [Waterburya agarophytonicola KI4]